MAEQIASTIENVHEKLNRGNSAQVAGRKDIARNARRDRISNFFLSCDGTEDIKKFFFKFFKLCMQ